MPHGYTPGLRVTDRALIRKRRHLPLPGHVHVEVGEPVSADQLVASTELPGNVTNVNVAHELSCTPEDVPEYLTVAVGEAVEAGQVIAETRALWGLFHSIATTPVSGTVEAASEVTGQVLIRGEPIRVELDAYIDGTVVEVEGDEAVTVETRGALLQGILGVGGEAHGDLKLLIAAPEAPLEPELVDGTCAGCVLVGGSLARLEALRAAVEVGAAGVVVGGIQGGDLDQFLGEPLGVAITGHEDVGTTVILTEGFGQIPMAQRSFELLAAREGQRASINGATQIRAGVIRPEVIIPEPGATWQTDEAEAGAALEVGVEVRLIREPYFGRLARVTALPEQLEEIETEARVRVLRARLADTGEEVTVPRANVEVIQR
jgi:hypothetical protein